MSEEVDSQRPVKRMRKEKPPIGNRIIYLLIGLAGLILIYSAVVMTARTTWLRLFGRETVGIVTAVEEEWRDVSLQDAVRVDRQVTVPERRESRLHYRALVSVKTDEGAAEISSRRVEEVPPYAVGAELNVLYLPGRLNEAQIKDEIASIWTQFFMGIVGLVMATATIGRPLVRRFITV